MTITTPRIVAVAILAGVLGLAASVWFDGNPFWRTLQAWPARSMAPNRR